jgi:hypothetical protein
MGTCGSVVPVAVGLVFDPQHLIYGRIAQKNGALDIGVLQFRLTDFIRFGFCHQGYSGRVMHDCHFSEINCNVEVFN